MIAVAPSSVEITNLNNGSTVSMWASLPQIQITSIKVIDTDSTTFNCSLYINDTFDVFGTGFLNNSDALGLEMLVDTHGLYRIIVNCTDGVNYTQSPETFVTFSPAYTSIQYDAEDVAPAVVNTFAKTFIAIGTLITMIVAILMLSYLSNKLIGKK